MFDFPKWKLGLVVVLVLLAAIYALPNVFPEQPAIQISANRGSTIDEVLQGRVEGTLKGKEIPYFQVERTAERLMVRFPDADHQLKGADALREELKEKYTVALNLASTVPGWLSTVGARPMTLGLDLQGGVHFLMEVDQQAARAYAALLKDITGEPATVVLSDEKASSARIEKFADIVNRAGYASPVRTPRGRDIFAACGQLKSETERLKKKDREALTSA